MKNDTLLTLVFTFVFTVPLIADELLDTYYEKLASISPRDATAHYELAAWCREKGLERQTQRLLERVIEIDPDHAAARQSLGYRRYGLEWKLGSEIPSGDLPTDAEQPSESTPEGTETGEAEVGTVAKPTAADEEGTTELESIEDLVERKKQWAAESAEKLALELNTHEDRDFLLHTSYPLGARQVKSFLAQLREIKESLQDLLGLKSQTLIWPDKVQFFYLRAIECVDFSERILARRFSDQDGWDPINEQSLLLHRIEEDDLAHFLGHSALSRLGGSRQWVGWWLREGVAELVAAQTDAGKEKEVYQENLLLVADEVLKDPDAYLLRNLLETPQLDETNPRRSRAVAMTFVDFLDSARGRRLSRFVEALKEEQGEQPSDDVLDDADSPEFRRFMIQYIHRQQELLKTHFRYNVDELEKKWKEYVLKKEKTIDRSEAPPAGRRGRAVRNTGRNTGRGAGRPPGGRTGGRSGGGTGENERQ